MPLNHALDRFPQRVDVQRGSQTSRQEHVERSSVSIATKRVPKPGLLIRHRIALTIFHRRVISNSLLNSSSNVRGRTGCVTGFHRQRFAERCNQRSQAGPSHQGTNLEFQLQLPFDPVAKLNRHQGIQSHLQHRPVRIQLGDVATQQRSQLHRNNFVQTSLAIRCWDLAQRFAIDRLLGIVAAANQVREPWRDIFGQP